MKLCLIVFCSLVFIAPAYATEFGILPFPKDVDFSKPEEFVKNYGAALGEVAGVIKNPLNVSLIGWEKLEPDEGEYRVKDEFGGMAYSVSALGYTPYMGMTTIDTVKRVLPDDLEDEDWTSNDLFDRYKLLLDEAAIVMPRDLKFFIIGNEVDVYFEKHPDEVAAYLTFIQKVKPEVKKRFPQARVSVSVTFDGLIQKRDEFVTPFVSASDMAVFTFYPMVGVKDYPVGLMPTLLDKLIQNAQGKDVFLQEVGFPSSPDAHSSPERQAEVFKTIIPAIAARPQIKYASIFIMHDFGKPMCDAFTDYYSYDTREFRGFLCSLGLKYDDGTPKPAWNAAVQAIQAAQQGRVSAGIK
ncbi:MAG: hypothetical protein WC043_01700 [Pseudobdellovibrionaceae bacterium]